MADDNGIFEDFCDEICNDTVVPSTAPDAALEGTTIVTSTAPGTTLEGATTVTHTEGFHSPDLPVCEKFVHDTCGCTKADGKPCSSLFSMEHYLELRAQASFLTHDELDLVLMGSIMSTILTDDVAWCRHKQREAELDNYTVYTCTTVITSAKELSCFCMELGRNTYWQLKIRITTMGWRPEYTRTERAFPITIDHLRSSKILWHFYKIIVKKMQYCYLDASQGLKVMTLKYFHQARVKRYSTMMTVVLSISFLVF